MYGVDPVIVLLAILGATVIMLLGIAAASPKRVSTQHRSSETKVVSILDKRPTNKEP